MLKDSAKFSEENHLYVKSCKNNTEFQMGVSLKIKKEHLCNLLNFP
jgi:hypothetical protein